MKMIKVIFDTDIGGDPDDAGALALIHEADKLGEAKLLGVMMSTPRPYTTGCVDAINRWYSNIVPLGQTHVIPADDDGSCYMSSYGKKVAEKYPNSYGSRTTEESAVRVLRRILAENEGDGITYIITGYCTNLAGLMKSGPDDISELDGKTLVEKNIDKLVIMAGNYEVPELECNISSDIPAAIYLFNEFTKPVLILGSTEGEKIKTGKLLLEKDPENPVSWSYYYTVKGPRYSWDPITAFAAIYGCENVLELSNAGKVTVDENGIATFTEANNGLHRLIYLKDLDEARERIDRAMVGEM